MVGLKGHFITIYKKGLIIKLLNFEPKDYYKKYRIVK